VLGTLASDMRWAGDARLALEVALVRMARPEGELTLEALAERIAALEAGTPVSAPRPVPVAPRPAPETPARPQAPEAKRAERKPQPEPEAAPAPEVYEPGAGGTLDRAQVKRAWPAIVAEVKKQRVSTAMLFSSAAADVDGDTLVVEFPADQRPAKELAEEQDAMQMLRRAVHSVLGVKPGVRYQLGRGVVKHEEPKPAARHEPADAGDTHPQPTGDPDPVDILASEFGDVVVEQHDE
jgi:DNA polymerase-3 subunit gamma/tau